MALTQEQLDFFHQNGYLKFGALLEPDEIETLRAQYDEEFRRAVESNHFRNIAQDDGGDSRHKVDAKKQMFQLMQMCERNIHFRKLIYDARILDTIQDLIGPNIQLYHDQALFKPARHGDAVPWHQDNGYWRCRPANMVSCWMTLDDVDADNGAMQVIPGSHLKPVWHERTEQTDALLNIQGVNEADAVVCALPAGGVMFHHCQTLHHTAPNTTDRPRRAFAMHFMTPGTAKKSGEACPVGFDRPLVRASL